jgi:hypothetical protein
MQQTKITDNTKIEYKITSPIKITRNKNEDQKMYSINLI